MISHFAIYSTLKRQKTKCNNFYEIQFPNGEKSNELRFYNIYVINYHFNAHISNKLSRGNEIKVPFAIHEGDFGD